MKQYTLLVLFALLFVLNACNENNVDELFEKSAIERIAEKKGEYTDLLRSSENGWLVEVTPNDETVGMYNFFINFDEKGKATLSSDLEILDFVSTLDQAYYQVKYTKDMTLAFTTYSQMNILYGPNSDGQSLGGDIELIFKEVSNDKIVFEGKVNQSKYVFEKATTSEYVNTLNIIRMIEMSFVELVYEDEYKFLTVTLDDGSKASFKFDFFKRILTAYSVNPVDNSVLEQTMKYKFDLNGLKFQEPVQCGTTTLNRISFVESSNSFTVERGVVTMEGLFAVPLAGMADLFLDVKYGPVTGWSRKAKAMRNALQDVDERFTTLQFYNDKYCGWAFKFSDPSEWPMVDLKDRTIIKLGEDHIKFVPGQYNNDLNGTIRWDALLKIPEAKALHDILFDPQGFRIYPEQAARLISVKDPDIWFLVSNFGDD